MKQLNSLIILLILSVFLSPVFAQKSLLLNGSTQYATSTSGGPTGTSSRTVECWIRSSTNIATQQVMVDMGNMTTGRRFTFNLIYNGKIRIEVGGNGFHTSSNVADGKWHHVAVTFNNSLSTTAIIYVDGVQEASGNFSVSVNTGTDPIIIGRRNDAINYFDGDIDEVRIWSTDLSQATIRNWMCKELNSSHPNYSSLHTYFKMDTLSGTTMRDYSGNSRNATTTGSPTWRNEGAPVGVSSVNTYGGSSLFLTHPDGDSLRVSNISGSPSGVHVFYRNTAPNKTGIPSGILSFDSSRHWGVHVVGGTNSSYNMNYYFTQNTHYQNYGICGIKWLSRNDNSVASWANSGATNGGNVLSLTGQTGKEYLLGYETAGSGPIITSPTKTDTTVVCVGDTVTLSTVSNPLFNYQWLVNGQVSVGDTTANLKVSSAGQYRLIQSKGSVCVDTSNTLTVVFTTIPTVTLAPFQSVCVSEFSVPLIGGLPAGGNYQTQYASGNSFIVKNAGVGKHKIIYEYRTSSGCGDTASQMIEVLALPNVIVDLLDTTCIDSGTITLSGGLPAGGMYFVNGTQTPTYNTNTLGIGRHWVKYDYSDANNCMNSDSTQIEIFPLPTLQLLLSKDKFCEYDATYTPNGHSPRGGVFSGPGMNAGIFNPSTAGVGKHGLVYTYADPVTTCRNSITDSVQVFPKPAAPIITANGLVLTASGTGTFQWHDKNGKILEENKSTYTVFFNGTYKVELTANGCRSDMSEIFEVNYVGLEEQKIGALRVFPNPFSDRIEFSINGYKQPVHFELWSLDGRQVLQGELDSEHTELNTSGLESGTYLLRLGEQGEESILKVTKF